jgi:hypothetical protein
MTVIQSTATAFPRSREKGPGSRAGAMAAVAFAAAVAGAVIGVGGAVAVPSVTRDHAAEQARLQAQAEALRKAIVDDYLWEISHPKAA